MDSAPAYDVNRDLIASDLDRLASSLSPLIVSRLESLAAAAIRTLEESPAMKIGVLGVSINVAPLLAKMARAKVSQALPLPPDSATRPLSDALRTLLELSDAELSTLCEVMAAELGAWAGALPPVAPNVLAVALMPVGHELGADG